MLGGVTYQMLPYLTYLGSPPPCKQVLTLWNRVAELCSSAKGLIFSSLKLVNLV